MNTILQDLRFAVRSLRKKPVFTAVAALSVALGVGFTATIFSAANALLLRPVAGVDNPERVVEIGRTDHGQGFDTFTYPELRDLSADVEPLAAVAGWRTAALSWGTADGGERISGMSVSGSYFSVLGAGAARGRLFGPEEDERGGPAVVVLGYRFWQERLGADPDIVGRTLDINRTPFTVIGVAQRGFRGHVPMIRVDAWTPLARSELAEPNFHTENYDSRRVSWLNVIARLREGETVERAGTAVEAEMARLAEAYPATNEVRGAKVVALGPVPGAGRSYVAGFLAILLGLVGLILLIAASNVAGMLLARAADREQEIAIRLAIGSGRARLLRQLTAESVALFLLGGMGGTVLAFAGASALSGFSPPGLDILTLDLSADGTVLLFALGTALVTGLLFGLVPAINASRPDLVSALKSAGRGGRRRARLQRGFAAGQVALSLVLLAAAGLFLRALQRAGDVDPGFEPDGVQVAAIDLALDGYNEDGGRQFLARLESMLAARPGFDAVGMGIDLPLDMGSHGTAAWPEGFDDPDGRGVGVDFNIVSPGFFETLRVPVLRGRRFTDGDGPGAPQVAIVGQAFAEQVWPDRDPIGQRLRFGGEDELRTVVGVVADVKNQMLGEVVDPMVYLPIAQSYRSDVRILARGAGVTGRSLRSAILEADSRLAVGEIQRMEAIAGLGLLPQQVAAWTAGAMGSVALLLAILGVYGVIAYAVVQRRREIGLRMAVGATRGSVLRLVVGSGLRLALPGIVVGGLLALGAARLIRSLLFGVSPTDPLAFGAVAGLLLAAVAAASVVPALRAARQDPMGALRSE